MKITNTNSERWRILHCILSASLTPAYLVDLRPAFDDGEQQQGVVLVVTWQVNSQRVQQHLVQSHCTQRFRQFTKKVLQNH